MSPLKNKIAERTDTSDTARRPSLRRFGKKSTRPDSMAVSDSTEDTVSFSERDFCVRDVLVGSIRSDEQLQINLSEKFYYVPARYVSPSSLPVKYVAIYQSVYNCESGIRYYAQVLETQKIKRADIKVRMSRNNGDEDYYLFKVDEWKTLDRPISAVSETVKEPRLTSSFLLFHCESTYELFCVRNADEYRLLCELKQMLMQVSQGIPCGKTYIDNLCSVTYKGGYFKIFDRKGKTVSKYPTTAFQKNPKDTFAHIKADMKLT